MSAAPSPERGRRMTAQGSSGGPAPEAPEKCPRCGFVKFAGVDLPSLRREAAAQALEEAAAIAEQTYPRGGAHTYASENADRYIALEDACEVVAKRLRARAQALREGR